jgi:hypothetical protein
VVKALENIFGGEPTLTSYDGTGQYTSFIDGVGGGGGGGYTPPVTPNPIFVPPTYSGEITNNSIRVNLIVEDGGEVEFLENGSSKGYGVNTTVSYSPSTTFNGSKKYEVIKNGYRANEHYVVSITKTYVPAPIEPTQRYDYYYNNYIGVNSFGLDNLQNLNLFNWNYNITPTVTAIDYRYSEMVSVQKYILQSDGSYVAEDTNNFNVGTINLQFSLKANSIILPPPIDIGDQISAPIEYEIAFSSNFRQELAENVVLSYTIFANDGTISDSGKLRLLDSNVIRNIESQNLNGRVDFKIDYVNKPAEYSLTNIYQTTNTAKLAEAQPDSIDFTKWNTQNSAFSLPAQQLKSGISVVVFFEKEINVARPIISLDTTQYSVQVKDSDLEKEINIPFKVSNTDNVRVYIDGRADTILVPASDGFVKLYFQKDFSEVYGTKKIILVAESSQYGTGDSVTGLVTFTAVNDFPSITEITFADTIDVPSFSDLNIDLTYEYSSFATSTIDVDLKAKDGSRIPLFKSLTPNGNISINLKTLRDKFSNWSTNNGLTLIFKPFNRSGSEELIGNEYEIKTELILPSIQLDENIFGTAIFDSFLSQLEIIEPERESKYLTHLANFDNNDQILISTWENDNWTLSSKAQDELGNSVITNEVNSILLKLYEPIPTNIVPNTTFWITKLMANPLVETIVLTDQSNLKCPPLKGPNFNVDVDYVIGNSTNFESLDGLILSSSTSNTQLISTYLSGSTFDTDNLNIEYVSGSTYLWNNFVHFSSAKERVDNFLYKVQLIEAYDNLIVSASTDITNTGFINSVANQQELERQSTKRNQLVNGFDGFEKFLYTSSSAYTTNDASSITWPYNNGDRISSNDTSSVLPWYNNIIELATDYDSNNQNYILNNIPQYIVNDENNDSLLLFFSMVGQHFDSIYYYTKSIEKSRGLGYKQTGGISDKLLFDALKSFSWDAKNLAANENLWKYAFGLDSEGTVVESNPAKQRTNEVWRRIVNNIPYLLKHKGTRRGVYALLACYGIPSSNLSILEFGGPEVTETTKSKLVYDNITTALKFNNGASIEVDWKNTNKNRKPNTIELFVKPEYNSTYTLISGSGWNLNLSGSAEALYGKVVFNYSGSQAITSSLLPIFNDRFFGISVSSGSNGLQLDIKQSDKERTLFEQSITSSAISNWNNGSKIKLGGNYSGSVDEFRLWSDVLNTNVFNEHVAFPEMINGNHVSASTTDLHFRLDFEYPKNLAQTASLINVDTNIYFAAGKTRNDYESGSLIPLYSLNPSASLYASASGFTPVTTYPFQFEAIDRSVVLEIPDLGSTRYSTNKVRFESQTDFSGNDVSGGIDLSIKSRATKKSFDQSPTDSNRVGLFFSPTKELNLDIAKSLGGINLDNYIGDPSDNYKSNYSKLDTLRNYYFERFDGRDIYAYINLIKLYEKSMFEDIKNMLPARVKATTGLLIEPHILERSKIEQKRPTADEYQKEVNIKYSDTTKLIADSNQYLATINSDLSEQLSAENNQYSATIYTASLQTTTADSYQIQAEYNYDAENDISSEYYQKEITLNVGLGNPSILTEIDIYDTNTIVGQSVYETLGFGIYAQSGSAIRTYFDKEGRRVKERVRVQLITEEKERVVTKFAVTASATGLGDPRGGYVSDIQTYNETTLNIQPFSGSIVPIIGGNIIDIKNVDGYLSTHYRNTSDLTRGLQNSFFRGSKNTAATTLDGSSPIETFTSNPNTLKVNKSGRDASEPILEVE